MFKWIRSKIAAYRYRRMFRKLIRYEGGLSNQAAATFYARLLVEGDPYVRDIVQKTMEGV